MAGALGIHPGLSQAKLWRKLLGKETPAELKPNPVLEQMFERGRANEHLCIADMEIASGVLADHTGENQLTKHVGRIRSTPDGIYDVTTFEAKCISSTYSKWMDPKVEHLCQCQTHMYVHDGEECIFGRWEQDVKSCVWIVYRCDEYIEWMLENVKPFFKLLDDEEPPPRKGKRPVPPDTCRVERIQ